MKSENFRGKKGRHQGHCLLALGHSVLFSWSSGSTFPLQLSGEWTWKRQGCTARGTPARGGDDWLSPAEAEKRAPALSDSQMRPAAGWQPPEKVIPWLIQPIWNSWPRWTGLPPTPLHSVSPHLGTDCYFNFMECSLMFKNETNQQCGLGQRLHLADSASRRN